MQNQTFRLFVSSPFSDFKKERDVLHKKVFPKIDKYCNENGFSFQPVDLRWGVSAEAQLDQKTLEVCLEEVRACKHFPHPNFLIMAGDRYGYIPLPYMIEKAEFDKIKEIYENDKEKISINYEVIKDEKGEVLSQKAPKKLEKLELLDEWYKLDENQIPISYILKPRTDEYKEYLNWQIDQEYLRTILQYTANILFENKEDKEYQKYFTSATEAEVLEGILEYKDITHTQEKLLESKIVENPKIDKEYVYGYIRTIENPNGQYIDFTEDKKNKEFLKQKVEDFKRNLSNTLNKDKNILPSSYDSIELYEENELKKFEEFIYEKLIKAIETQKNKSNEISHIQKEIIEQEKFKNDKQKGFIGRENTLDKIENYVLNDKTNEPLVIYGISGMGKSSLMAQAINNTSKLFEKDNLIYRFVGATQNSTTIRSLLISICDELANKNIIEKIKEYEYDEYKFFKQINETLSNIKKTIVLFIDALDQLQFKDSLQWLPENLPQNFKIILSVLNDEKYEKDSHYYNILKNKVHSNNLIDISKDSLESSKEDLVKNLLSDLNRKIDDYQTKYLIDKWKETNYSPLYLKIAIEEVKHWKSGDTSQKLESNIEGIVKEYIKNLTKIYHHEEIFVNKVFGYIHASKDGLSEKELLEILSEDLEDEILMKDKIINEYHEPIKIKNPRRENKEELILPMSIWSRLHTQIKPFIIQRNIDNQPLMKFFHREFTSVIDSLIKDNRIQLHTKLSKYFYTLQDKSKTWNKRYHNLHMLNEYPYQLFHSKQSEELKEILFDLEFAGSVYDNNKQESFRDIMSKATQLENIIEDEIYPWESFYREKEHLILKVNEELWRPYQSLFQLAYEDGLTSPIREKAKDILAKDIVNWNWLENQNISKDLIRTGLIKVISLENNFNIESFLIWNNSLIVFSHSRNGCMLLDINQKKIVKEFFKKDNYFFKLERFDEKHFISYESDKTNINLWHIEKGFIKKLNSLANNINFENEKVEEILYRKEYLFHDYNILLKVDNFHRNQISFYNYDLLEQNNDSQQNNNMNISFNISSDILLNIKYLNEYSVKFSFYEKSNLMNEYISQFSFESYFNFFNENSEDSLYLLEPYIVIYQDNSLKLLSKKGEIILEKSIDRPKRFKFIDGNLVCDEVVINIDTLEIIEISLDESINRNKQNYWSQAYKNENKLILTEENKIILKNNKETFFTYLVIEKTLIKKMSILFDKYVAFNLATNKTKIYKINHYK